MALGSAQVQQRFENPREILGDRLREGSIYRLLSDHGHQMFPDDYFFDLYSESANGRPTIPARVMATVMVLQAFEGLSDREATDRLEVDLRWQAAAGVDTGYVAFHPTALVGQRNRLRASDRPRRLFEDTRVAKETGAMKHRARVLDSTPIFDAVATEDTVTQMRALHSSTFLPSSSCIDEVGALRSEQVVLSYPSSLLRPPPTPSRLPTTSRVHRL
jgi:hypothetical protein